jgi:hypothetical protein
LNYYWLNAIFIDLMQPVEAVADDVHFAEVIHILVAVK